MSTKVAPNMYIMFGDSKITKRVICYENGIEFVYLIDINDDLARPEKALTTSIQFMLDNADAWKEDDPHSDLDAVDFSKLSETEQSDIKKIYNVILKLTDNGKNLSIGCSEIGFIQMGKWMAELLKPKARTCQKYWRWILQVGLKENALVDRRKINSGGPGKSRFSISGRRLGNHRDIDRLRHEIILQNEIKASNNEASTDVKDLPKAGIALTEEDIKKIELALTLYDDQEHITDIYAEMQRNLYNIPDEAYTTEDGVRVPKIRSNDSMPTFRQFDYQRKKIQNPVELIAGRVNEHNFHNNYAAKTGRVQDYAVHPAIFGMDFSVLDIYGASSLNRNLPVPKLVVGITFMIQPHYITGVLVTPFTTAFSTVALLLLNTFLDKAELCQMYGLKSIKEGMWPGGLCTTLLYDKGNEIIGEQGDALIIRMAAIKNLPYFQIDNTRSFGGVDKSVVENSFKQIKRVMAKMPGYSDPNPQYGDPNPMLQARLSQQQIYKIALKLAYNHNMNHEISDYPLSEGMIEDNIIPTPHNLREWLLDNQYGQLPSVDRIKLETALLLDGDAIVTGTGIHFKIKRHGKALIYTCDLAEQKAWFDFAKNFGVFPLKAIYHPDITDYIVLRANSKKPIPGTPAIAIFDHNIRCSLMPNSEMEPMQHRTWADVEAYHANRRNNSSEHKVVEDQSDAEVDAYIKHEIKLAEEQYEFERDNSSNRARLQGMKDRQEEEREIFAEKHAFQLFQPDSKTEVTAEDEQKNPPTDQTITYPNHTAQFREILNKKRNQSGDQNGNPDA